MPSRQQRPAQREKHFHPCTQGKFPSKNEAELLRAEGSQGKLTASRIREILCRKTKMVGITIPAKRIRHYFPPDYTKEQIEMIVFRLLDTWKEGEII